MSKLSPPLKWHGGKHYLAPPIVAMMPPHLHYVEPYFGGGSVLLAKDPEGVSEVVNDIDGRLTNFWRCLSCEASFERLLRFCEATPFCEAAWVYAAARLDVPCAAPATNCVACALAFFVCCRQSLAGRQKSFAPLSRRRVRRGMNEQASAWLTALEGLPEVHARLRRVVILNRDALDVVAQQDGEDTLFYLDPPYLDETRTAPQVYAHEMTGSQHFDLLLQVKGCKGKVMLSGYRSKLYDDALASWNRHDFDLPNNAAGGDEKRRMTESLWCNF